MCRRIFELDVVELFGGVHRIHDAGCMFGLSCDAYDVSCLLYTTSPKRKFWTNAPKLSLMKVSIWEGLCKLICQFVVTKCCFSGGVFSIQQHVDSSGVLGRASNGETPPSKWAHMGRLPVLQLLRYIQVHYIQTCVWLHFFNMAMFQNK